MGFVIMILIYFIFVSYLKLRFIVSTVAFTTNYVNCTFKKTRNLIVLFIKIKVTHLKPQVVQNYS